jgi:hypothetical protein
MKKKISLYLYKLFLKEFQLIQANNVKFKWIENCEFAFELEGKKYLKFRSATDLPLNRMERMQILLIQLENRLSKHELTTLIEIGEKSLESALNSVKTKNRIEGVSQAFWVFNEMKARHNDLMFHPEILCELAALTIVQEGEDATVVDDQLHRFKVDLFMRQGGSADFFTRSGVISLFPNPELLLKKSQELWVLHLNQIQSANKTYDTILTEVNATTG